MEDTEYWRRLKGLNFNRRFNYIVAMVDLEGKDKGNISLPQRLQPPNIEEDDYLLGEEHKVTIMNMQKAMYEIKIADLEKRIQRFSLFCLLFSSLLLCN